MTVNSLYRCMVKLSNNGSNRHSCIHCDYDLCDECVAPKEANDNKDSDGKNYDVSDPRTKYTVANENQSIVKERTMQQQEQNQQFVESSQDNSRLPPLYGPGGYRASPNRFQENSPSQIPLNRFQENSPSQISLNRFQENSPRQTLLNRNEATRDNQVQDDEGATSFLYRQHPRPMRHQVPTSVPNDIDIFRSTKI